MSEYTIWMALTEHPALLALIVLGAVLVLHLPHRIEVRRDARRREHVLYVSLLYRYEAGPGYERLRYHGLRHVQRAILDLLGAVWAALRGDVLRRLIDAARRRLGL